MMKSELSNLMAVDRALASRAGLQVREFCQRNSISVRTLRRYIRRVREMGQSVDLYEYDDGTNRYHYAERARPIFTANLTRHR